MTTTNKSELVWFSIFDNFSYEIKDFMKSSKDRVQTKKKIQKLRWLTVLAKHGEFEVVLIGESYAALN